MILLDTNVLSEVMRAQPAPQVLAWMDLLPTNTIYVSSITEAEMLLGVSLLPVGKRRNALASQVSRLFEEYFQQRCLAFDTRAAAHYARIVSHRQRIGRPMSTEDGQIAAIACSQGYRLATRNVADFADIAGLSIINPWNDAKAVRVR